MIEKVTQLRKSLDIMDQIRISKLQELASPFVKYALDKNIQASVDHFLLWKDKFVTSETYHSVYNIEKVYGTALHLYISAMRSNNHEVLIAAQIIFSPLFRFKNQ